VVRAITEEEKLRCLDFATQIIRGNDQYNRFGQDEQVQIDRTYIGKLAEYAFYHLLIERGVEYELGNMFEIYEGAENADEFDFITANDETVDIKTASLPFHSRIMVPIDQYRLRKDFYVGIKLNFIGVEGRTIDPMNIESCRLCGYTTRAVLDLRPTEFFGEGNCKAISLNQLDEIEQLLNRFEVEA
jgi:hypothetical protein